MKISAWWGAALVALGIGGYEIQKKLARTPRPGDVAIAPVSRVLAQATGTAAGVTTPLADGTIQIDVTAGPDTTGRVAGTIRNVFGVTVPIFVQVGDIMKLTRNNVVVT